MRQLITICLLMMGWVVNYTQEVAAYLPENMTDWIRIDKDKVNLRKEPSASSLRLMYEEFDEATCGNKNVIWGQKETAKLHPEQAYQGFIGPMLGRNHDYNPRYDDIPSNADLWVKIGYLFQGREIPAWVKQSFCEVRPIFSLNPEYYYKDEVQKYMLNIRQGGKYDGLSLFLASPVMTPEDPEGLFVGKFVDGKVVLPLRFSGNLRSSDDVRNIEVENGYILYPQKFEVGVENEMEGHLVLDMSKFSDSDIEKILRQCEPQSEEIILFANPFDGGYMQFNISTEPNERGGRFWFEFPLNKTTLSLSKESSARIVNRPKVSSINPGVTLERVLVQPEGTTLELSFINTNGLRQWNVNCYAYITCDATPGKEYKLLRTRGVNISPKPTNLSGNRNEKVSFSMTFEPIPLESSSINLVEGPSRDNFHINNIDISSPK